MRHTAFPKPFPPCPGKFPPFAPTQRQEGLQVRARRTRLHVPLCRCIWYRLEAPDLSLLAAGGGRKHIGHRGRVCTARRWSCCLRRSCESRMRRYAPRTRRRAAAGRLMAASSSCAAGLPRAFSFGCCCAESQSMPHAIPVAAGAASVRPPPAVTMQLAFMMFRKYLQLQPMLIRGVIALQRQRQVSHACEGRAEVRHCGRGLHVSPFRRVQQRAAQQRVRRPVHAGDTQHFGQNRPS